MAKSMGSRVAAGIRGCRHRQHCCEGEGWGQPGDALCPDLRLDPTQLGTAAKQSLETCSRCYPCSHLSASDSSQSRKAAPSILLGSIWALLAGTAPDPCSAQSKD